MIYSTIKDSYKRYEQPEEIHDLEIPDIYHRKDTELREKLYRKLNRYLKEKGEI